MRTKSWLPWLWMILERRNATRTQLVSFGVMLTSIHLVNTSTVKKEHLVVPRRDIYMDCVQSDILNGNAYRIKIAAIENGSRSTSGAYDMIPEWQLMSG